jgi:hypothetical protein
LTLEDETGNNLSCVISQKRMDPNYHTSSVVDESNMSTKNWWNNNDEKESM